MRRRFGNGYRVGPLSDGERRVHYHLAVDIDHNTGAAERLEPGRVYLDVVAANWQTLERIEAPAIRRKSLL